MEDFVKQILSLGGTILIVLFISSSAMAIGIGVYGDVQRGTTNYAQDFSGSTSDIGVTGGLVFDTNVAKDSLFNYRAQLGAGQVWSRGLTVNKASLIQTFGISPAPLRGEKVRFWFGPRIGLHYLNSNYSNMIGYQDLQLIMMMLTGSLIPPTTSKVTMNGFKGDIGLVLAGFNFNFGKLVTLSLEFGFDYGYMIGKADFEEGTPKRWLTAAGEGFEGFATMAVLFRINDNYGAQSIDMAPEKPEKKMQIQVQQ
jgi:hypothetical protein